MVKRAGVTGRLVMRTAAAARLTTPGPGIDEILNHSVPPAMIATAGPERSGSSIGVPVPMNTTRVPTGLAATAKPAAGAGMSVDAELNFALKWETPFAPKIPLNPLVPVTSREKSICWPLRIPLNVIVLPCCVSLKEMRLPSILPSSKATAWVRDVLIPVAGSLGPWLTQPVTAAPSGFKTNVHGANPTS